MKKYFIFIVTIMFGISMLVSFIIFQQRNSFDLHYAKTNPLYHPEELDDMAFQFYVNKSRYTWLVEGNGDQIDVTYQGKRAWGDVYKSEPYLDVMMKVEPDVIKQHQDDAVCEIGNQYCTISIDLMEVQYDVIYHDDQESQVVDTITVRAKDETKPIHVMVQKDNSNFDDENTLSCSWIVEGPSSTSYLYMVKNRLLSNKIMGSYFALDYDFMQLDARYYEISKNINGIYVKKGENFERILTFDPYQEHFTMVGMMQDDLIVFRNKKDTSSYLESYDQNGVLIVQQPLGYLERNPRYDDQNQNYLIQARNESNQMNLQIYKYQDRAFSMIDHIPDKEVNADNVTYYDGKLYEINSIADMQRVSVWNREGHLFDEDITGSLFDDLDLYRGKGANMDRFTEVLFKHTYMDILHPEIIFEMKGDT